MLKTVSSLVNAIGALNYKGTWNASTNTPTLASGVGTKGDYYVVSVAGTTNLDGITDWQIGDWAIFNGSAWQKIDNTDSVTSVNGQTGTVVIDADDVGAAANTVEIIAGTGLSGGGNLTANVTIDIDADQSFNNVTANNVVINATLSANLNSSNTATFTTAALPLDPEGYITVTINGTAKKIPYYGT